MRVGQSLHKMSSLAELSLSDEGSSSTLLNFRLRYRRPCTKAEVTAVGICPLTSLAFATYSGGQASAPWVDIFDSRTQKPVTKTTGSHAIFSPALGRDRLLATVRDWTVQLGSGGVEYHHSSTVLVRNVATGKTVAELKDARAQPIAYSRDGSLLAAAEAGNAPRMGVWDASTGAHVGRVMGHIDTITHTAFMPDNKLVTLSRDGTVRVTKLRGGSGGGSRTAYKLEVEGPGSTNPRMLAVSPDGSCIASLWGATMHVWYPRANQLTSYQLGSRRTVEGWPLCISPDCRYMACRTETGFDVMEVETGRVVFEHNDDYVVTAAAFATTGRTLLLGRMDGQVELWTVEG